MSFLRDGALSPRMLSYRMLLLLPDLEIESAAITLEHYYTRTFWDWMGGLEGAELETAGLEGAGLEEAELDVP